MMGYFLFGGFKDIEAMPSNTSILIFDPNPWTISRQTVVIRNDSRQTSDTFNFNQIAFLKNRHRRSPVRNNELFLVVSLEKRMNNNGELGHYQFQQKSNYQKPNPPNTSYLKCT
jgi:hypothetical protein